MGDPFMEWFSVRFFKRLIFVCVIVMILVPTTLATVWRIQLTDATEQVKSLEEELTLTQQMLDDVQQAEIEATDASEPLNFSAEAPSYQALYPDFYAPQSVNLESEPQINTIYLTFDDGPTYNTDDVLDILAEQGVKATFFVTGHTGDAAEERLRNIVAQGHTIGMHSYSHEYAIIYESVEAFLDDMYQVFVLIRDVTGQTPTAFRFPGGSINSYNTGIYQELIAEMLRRGFVPYDWNISAQDATSAPLSAQTLLSNVTASAAGKERGIVLMHDSVGNSSTVQALNSIIDYFQERGFSFDCIHPDTKPVLFGYPN